MRFDILGIVLGASFLAGCHSASNNAGEAPAPSAPPPQPVAIAPPPPPPPVTVPVVPSNGAPVPKHRLSRSPASAGTGGTAEPSNASDVEDDESEQIHAWYSKLPTGWVRYEVPRRMTMGRSYPVSAFIPPLGSDLSNNPKQDAAKTQTVDKGIHLSTYMRVQLDQPANPGVFNIESPRQDCRFISQDGSTRWQFTVTPQHSGKNEQLTFTTSVLYGKGVAACAPDNLHVIDVTTDTESVTVDTLNARDSGHDLKEDAVKNPGKWAGYVKYLLPGGAVFSVVAGLVAWWKKRSSGGKASSADPKS